jgi:hypothetical protein
MTLFAISPSLRHAAMPRIDRAIWPLTTHVDELGRLCVGGTALTEVADEFGTPPTSSTRPTFVIGFGATARRSRRPAWSMQERRS